MALRDVQKGLALVDFFFVIAMKIVKNTDVCAKSAFEKSYTCIAVEPRYTRLVRDQQSFVPKIGGSLKLGYH